MAIATKASDAADMSDIRRYIANPPKTSVVMEITPALADAILQTYNTENRGLKPRKVKNIVSAIRNETWLVTGETIKFSSKRLIDGQNRLNACLESGRSIVSHVVFGIADEAFAIIDTGASRTPGDILHIAGIRDPNAISHIITWIYTLETSRGSRSRLQLSPNEILHLHRTKYSDAAEHIGWGRLLQKATGAPVTRGALLHYAFSRAQPGPGADHFLSTWVDHEMEDGSPQARLLRRRLAQMASFTSGMLPVALVYATAIKAWNAYIRDRNIGVADLRWAEGEPFPRIESDASDKERAAAE